MLTIQQRPEEVCDHAIKHLENKLNACLNNANTVTGTDTALTIAIEEEVLIRIQESSKVVGV